MINAAVVALIVLAGGVLCVDAPQADLVGGWQIGELDLLQNVFINQIVELSGFSVSPSELVLNRNQHANGDAVEHVGLIRGSVDSGLFQSRTADLNNWFVGEHRASSPIIGNHFPCFQGRGYTGPARHWGPYFYISGGAFTYVGKRDFKRHPYAVVASDHIANRPDAVDPYPSALRVSSGISASSRVSSGFADLPQRGDQSPGLDDAYNDQNPSLADWLLGYTDLRFRGEGLAAYLVFILGVAATWTGMSLWWRRSLDYKRWASLPWGIGLNIVGVCMLYVGLAWM